MREKKLGLPSAISTGVGLIVASSCLLTLGSGIGLAGPEFILSMAIVLVLNICLALSFTELHALMPEADGGMGQYTLAGLGPVVSIVSNVSAYVMVNLFAASVELAMCGQVLNETFLPMVPAPVISVAALLLLCYVNYRGVDLFDCVMPSRNARHGHLFTWQGIININNAKYELDDSPIDAECDCPVCQRHSRAYIRHLLKAGEMLGMRLAVMHNLYFYNTLMEKIRAALDEGSYEQFRAQMIPLLGRRI